ncbi:fumarylacetoacetate hydrolase family protein [Ammoniphilus sp. YIM 78166]|uniref:fumarylacetoacetate hydrolase family protein n=1 Tax=Ammoniphilus sp. YIM 78166 TaxID=1644106 RepID=UPI00106F7E70|nr:fumarylacetoacetate hydrolase family protein [Ammoniphilus sp. YIM 78166]
MYLSTFIHHNQSRYGYLTNDKNSIIDILKAEKVMFPSTILPLELVDLIGDPQAMERVEEIRKQLASQQPEDFVIPLTEVRLAAPIPQPKRNIICLGINYREHAYEFGKTTDDSKAIPTHPIVFTKATTTVIGPEEPIQSHPDVTQELDYEAELAIIIGREGSNISKGEAYDYIFGYTMVNDITARDLQRDHKQWFLGKSLDTFCPMGPYIATADEIGNPAMLEIQSRVNGEVRQQSNTELLIFDIPTIIETVSKGITLRPGDIIATGTPKGVGMGFEPPRFLKAGDVVEVEIGSLGVLRNPVA